MRPFQKWSAYILQVLRGLMEQRHTGLDAGMNKHVIVMLMKQRQSLE